MKTRPMTMWDRIRAEKLQPQVGDVLRVEPGPNSSPGVGRPVTVTKISGENGKTVDLIPEDHVLAGMRIAFYHGNGDMALDNGDCWEYVSRADDGPVTVEITEEKP